MQKIPRALCVHDLSGIGKCSLTVALPVLSTLSVEVAALPTAILSTHTAWPEGYTYRDLSDDTPGIVQHWTTLGITFGALYSGWLASPAQTAWVSSLRKGICASAYTLVDPVLGDHGRLYSTFDTQSVDAMRKLAATADCITPNLTEACLLLGRSYAVPVSVPEMLTALVSLGPQEVVVTGIPIHEGADVLTASLSANGFSQVVSPRIPGVWHGTGDLFASALLGARLSGIPLSPAVTIAAHFVEASIVRTAQMGTDPLLGVAFEPELFGLIQAVQEMKKHERCN